MGDIAREIPKTSTTLEDRQVDYQPNMIEMEGKLSKHVVSISIDIGAILCYLNPRLVYP